MNKNVLMIMGGALAVAILVALVVQSKLGGSSEPAKGVEILVATKKLLEGEKIKPDDVRWQSWPEDALFTGMIKRADQKDDTKLAVYDAPLRRTVEAGEPVTDQATISDAKGATNYLAASIAPGLRAVSVAVKPETAVSGFVGPGDYVDVILSYQPKLSGDMQLYSSNVVQNYASETILSNVRVLAVDQEVKNSEREAKTVKTVTLEVTKAGAETLYLAQTMGEISLSLRHMGDKDTDTDKKSSLTTDMSRSAVMKRVEKIKNEEKTSSDTVRVYSGSTIQNVPVRAGQQGQ
jgi:pilus assembly protein CpaB